MVPYVTAMTYYDHTNRNLSWSQGDKSTFFSMPSANIGFLCPTVYTCPLLLSQLSVLRCLLFCLCFTLHIIVVVVIIKQLGEVNCERIYSHEKHRYLDSPGRYSFPDRDSSKYCSQDRWQHRLLNGFDVDLLCR